MMFATLAWLAFQGVTGWLPDDVFLYVRVAGLTRAADEARATAPYRLWNDPDLTDDLVTLHSALRHGLGASQATELGAEARAAGATLERMRSLFRGPAHLALRKRDAMVRCTLVFEGLVMPTGRSGPEALTELIRHGRLASFLRGAPEPEDRAGLRLLRFPHPAAELRCALLGTTWILSDDPSIWDAVRASTGPASQPAAGVLARHPGFRSCVAALGSDDPTLFACFDPDALARATSATKADALGLAAVRSVGFALSVRDGRVVDRIHVDAPGGVEALFPGLRGGPTKATAAAAAPASTVLMATLPFDAIRVHQALTAAADAPPDSVFRRIHDVLYAGVGLRITDDLLQPLGREITFLAIVPGDNSLFPELGAVIEVRNQAALEAALPQMLKEQLGLSLHTLPFAGHTIHYGLGDHLGFVVHRSLPPVYAAPAWTVAQGHLLMGFRPLAVKRMLRALDHDGPSLQDDPRFQATVTGDLRALAPAGMVYFDTARLFEWLNQLGQWRQAVGEPGHWFPERPDAIRRHLGASLNALLLAPASAELRSFSAGASLSMAAALVGAGTLALDLRDRVRGIGPETAALHEQLAAVGGALAEIQEQGNGFPPGLDAVLQRVPAAQRERLPQLAWQPGISGTPSPETIVIAPAAPGPRGCRFFVRADGSVDWLPEPGFRDALERQRAARK